MTEFYGATLRALAFSILDEDERRRMAEWPEMIRDSDNDTLSATYLRAVEQAHRARRLVENGIAMGTSSARLAEPIKTAVMVEIWRDRIAEELAMRRAAGQILAPAADLVVH